MGEESVNLQIDSQTLEVHLVTLFEKLESLRNDAPNGHSSATKIPMQIEIRTLEFWRAVICECLASFVYVFVVCGAAAGSGSSPSFSSILITTALAAGFSMTTLTHCFGHISGAHINPAVTIAKGLTKGVSVLRTVMFIIAQCGGAIAGAAFLYGVSLPGHKANLAATVAHTSNVPAWERFGVEFILTFVVVLTYFVSMDSYRKWTSTANVTIGAAYTACTFVSMPYLNPARSLGPSFVLSKWDNHWVYWLGPLVGGAASGLIYEYILNPRRHRRAKDSGDGDSSSIHSDEDTYDDLDKPAGSKFHGSTYNTYRPSGGTTTNVPSGYCPSVTSTSLYSAPPTKLERVESLYGGTKSLYCKSPPLTRANLNRSQSVYTKSNSGVNRDVLPRPGPLVPTQSLYPMRLNQTNQQNHVQNQNMQNQMQQRSESIYGVRGVTPGTISRSDNYSTTTSDRGDYSTRTTETNSQTYEGSQKNSRTSNRPESMYGMVGTQRRGLSTQSDDSSYGSYHGSTNRSNANGNSTYSSSPNYPPKTGVNSTYNSRSNGPEVRQSPPSQLLPNTNSSSYHHSIPQHSPNSQY